MPGVWSNTYISFLLFLSIANMPCFYNFYSDFVFFYIYVYVFSSLKAFKNVPCSRGSRQSTWEKVQRGWEALGSPVSTHPQPVCPDSEPRLPPAHTSAMKWLPGSHLQEADWISFGQRAWKNGWYLPKGSSDSFRVCFPFHHDQMTPLQESP